MFMVLLPAVWWWFGPVADLTFRASILYNAFILRHPVLHCQKLIFVKTGMTIVWLCA